MDIALEKTIDLDGCPTQVSISGQGAPLVLLHGGPGAFDNLDSLAPLLRGYRLIRYDQRGGGESRGPGPYTTERLVEDLEALRQALEIESWIVAGHSWGAFLALAYAAKYPERTRGLVHISGTGLDPDWQQAYHANRRKKLSPAEQVQFLHLRQERDEGCAGKQSRTERQLLALNLKADFHDPEQVDKLPDMLRHATDPEVQSELMADWKAHLRDAGFRKAVAGLSMPVLLLHGAADPRPATGATTLSEALPQAELQVIDQAGHYPWLEQPEAFATVLRHFLAGLDPA